MKARVSKIRKFSTVWIIPVISALIGIVLMISHLNSKGHTFTIIAKNAEGIEAGKTLIKSKSVTVGSVTNVELSEGFQHVVIHGIIDKNMKSLLKDDTIFWVVSPQINRAGVSGFSTILSGAYIELKPGYGKDIDKKYTYTMLDSPHSTMYEPGIRLLLKSKSTKLLEADTPVQYHGYTVGKIESVDFDLQEQCIIYKIFIRKPYDTLITGNTKFWQMGAVNINMNTYGVNVSIPSLDVLLGGAVGFELPRGVETGLPAKDDDVFNLFGNYKDISEIEYKNYKEYLLLFSQSVMGLAEGAAVQFRGMRVGTVVSSPYFSDNITFSDLMKHVPVLIRIEPDRIMANIDKAELENFINNKNLRASLKSSSFLSNILYVDLGIYQNPKKVVTPENMYGYKIIPSMSGNIEQAQLSAAVDEFTSTLHDIKLLSASLRNALKDNEVQSLPADLKQTLMEINKTLESFREGSELYDNTILNMKAMEKALKELEIITKTLNQKSNALVIEADKQDVIPNKK